MVNISWFLGFHLKKKYHQSKQICQCQMVADHKWTVGVSFRQIVTSKPEFSWKLW